jgi:DNA-directed RNA polymerase subunit M
MKLCPKCGSICLPKKEGDKVVLKCSCGHKMAGEAKIKETVQHAEHSIEVQEKKIETLPTVKIKCPKCGHDEAYNWELQTRSPDEAATQFFRCKKCNHTWREYR